VAQLSHWPRGWPSCLLALTTYSSLKFSISNIYGSNRRRFHVIINKRNSIFNSNKLVDRTMWYWYVGDHRKMEAATPNNCLMSHTFSRIVNTLTGKKRQFKSDTQRSRYTSMLPHPPVSPPFLFPNTPLRRPIPGEDTQTCWSLGSRRGRSKSNPLRLPKTRAVSVIVV